MKIFERTAKELLYLPITVSLTQQVLLQISLDIIDSLQFLSTSCNGQQFLQSVKHATHVVEEYSHGPDEEPSSNSKQKKKKVILF